MSFFSFSSGSGSALIWSRASEYMSSSLSASMSASMYLAKWASYLVGSSSASISMYSFTWPPKMRSLCASASYWESWALISVCNGLLAGLVAVTASCSVIEPWAALICGFVGAFVYVGSCKLLLKLRIDDPLEAAPLHGFTGAWGVLFAGLMAKPSYVLE